MEDFFGQKLEIGDKVAVLLKGYRHLQHAEILYFTDKRIRVSYKVDGYSLQDTYLVSPNMLVKRPLLW